MWRLRLDALTAGLTLVHAGEVSASAKPTVTTPVGPVSMGRAVSYGVQIHALYTAAGNPLLGANFSPDGALAIPGWPVHAIAPPGLTGQARVGTRVVARGARWSGAPVRV